MVLPQTYNDWLEFFENYKKEFADSATYEKDKIGLLQFAAEELMKKNDFNGAKKFLDQGIKLAEKLGNRKLIADLLNTLAQVFYAQRDMQNADLYMTKAIEIFKQEFGEDAPEVINLYNNLAIIKEGLGDYDQAILLMLENIKRAKESGKFDQMYFASAYNNIAGIFWSKNQPENAREYLEKAREIKEKNLSADDPQLADVYNNLALVNLNLGNLQQAERYQSMAYDIIHQHNPESMEMVTALRNMALIKKEKNQTIEALEYLSRAVDILKKMFPHGHPEIDEALEVKRQWEEEL